MANTFRLEKEDPTLYKSIKKLSDKLEEWKFIEEILYCAATYIKSSLYKRPLYGTIGYPVGRHLDKKFNLSAKTGLKLKNIAEIHVKIISDRIQRFYKNITKQRENANYLLENLKPNNVVLPIEKKDCLSNYYQFAIRYKNTKQRDWMADYLFRQGIDTAKYLDEVIGVAKNLYRYSNDCPIAEKCSKTVLVVPHYYTLSISDLEKIVRSLNNGFEHFETLSI